MQTKNYYICAMPYSTWLLHDSNKMKSTIFYGRNIDVDNAINAIPEYIANKNNGSVWCKRLSNHRFLRKAKELAEEAKSWYDSTRPDIHDIVCVSDKKDKYEIDVA